MYSKIVKALLNFLFPPSCFGCNARLSGEEQTLCFRCAHDLPINEYSLDELPFFGRYFFTDKKVISGKACLPYSQNSLGGELIRHLKFRGHTWLSEWIAKKFRPQLKNAVIDLVVPIPLHPRRMRNRGYNQVDGFARQVAMYLEAEYRSDVLKVTYYRSPQARRSGDKRLTSSKNYFKTRKKASLKGKSVMVVDDVLTTGATLENAFSCLERAGVSRIYWMTMVWTPPH